MGSGIWCACGRSLKSLPPVDVRLPLHPILPRALPLCGAVFLYTYRHCGTPAEQPRRIVVSMP